MLSHFKGHPIGGFGGALKQLSIGFASNDPGCDHLIERIESRNGKLTVDAAAKLGVGSMEYDIIEV